jgi:hypothetical protein
VRPSRQARDDERSRATAARFERASRPVESRRWYPRDEKPEARRLEAASPRTIDCRAVAATESSMRKSTFVSFNLSIAAMVTLAGCGPTSDAAGDIDAASMREAAAALEAPENDSCPGTAITLARGQSETVSGSTLDASDDYTSFCADDTPSADAPDVVFAVTLTQSGVLEILLDDHLGTNEFDGAISIRKVACASENTSDECVNFETIGEAHRVDLAAGTYSIVVDGAGQSAGDFSLQLSLAAPACGDGITSTSSASEACDIIPVTAQSMLLCREPGHPDECQLVPAVEPSLDTCPGQTQTLTANTTQFITGTAHNTCPLNDDHIGSCAGENVGGRDAVYRVVPDSDGTITATVGNLLGGGSACEACGNDCAESCGTCFVPVLYARKGGCQGVGSTEVACAYDPDFVTTVATITVPVVANEEVWIFVDSNWDGGYTAGPYVLELGLE